ncbi:DUF1206 domain-containing protein [Nocardioides acrostichi]|uniref:DUF1206 domain-containing protein n=1 Tax=Nocardioides acrostichi TaxID=2784339 RepID=A0A930Y7N1_9ACTN|nr:DUF1206 domain-containing protein [Nocardioides acrostichi]MBF4162171.1 DUF1206 domain-containing protein [Nocardioides acrostichi]
MPDLRDPARDVARRGDDHPWVQNAARAGLLAYGLVNLLIGYLALRLALGDRSGSASSSGALHELAQQPLGAAAVWAVAVGMFLLVIWRGIEVVVDHEWKSGLKALLYLSIGVSAVKVAMGSGSKGGTDSWTATIMDLPGGQIIVGVVGLAVIGYGVAQIHKGWSEEFREDLDAEGQAGQSGRAFLVFGKVGYSAKGAAIGVVGILFCWAAVQHQPKRSGGLDVALQKILEAPGGAVLLSVVALGILCYGLFNFARAKHLDT